MDFSKRLPPEPCRGHEYSLHAGYIARGFSRRPSMPPSCWFVEGRCVLLFGFQVKTSTFSLTLKKNPRCEFTYVSSFKRASFLQSLRTAGLSLMIDTQIAIALETKDKTELALLLPVEIFGIL